jgi:carboxymethylenebutenolidase
MPQNTQQILNAADGHSLNAFQSLPDRTPRGAVVVLQEVFGVNDHIRSVTEGFALAGYAAIAPALFDRIEPGIELGYAGDDLARGRDLRNEIGWEAAVTDIAAAVQAVVGWGRVGVVGYCWGGSLAWLAATRITPHVAAAVCYYGGQIAQFRDETPKCPVQMHFGEQDPLIPADDVAAIRAAQPAADIHVYPAGHGFNCTARGDYDPDSARRAGERTAAFLAEHVG